MIIIKFQQIRRYMDFAFRRSGPGAEAEHLEQARLDLLQLLGTDLSAWGGLDDVGSLEGGERLLGRRVGGADDDGGGSGHNGAQEDQQDQGTPATHDGTLAWKEKNIDIGNVTQFQMK